ncbi:TPA: hypothetical protein ACT5CL_007545, partial [Burkholderia cenocepacia]
QDLSLFHRFSTRRHPAAGFDAVKTGRFSRKTGEWPGHDGGLVPAFHLSHKFFFRLAQHIVDCWRPGGSG